MTTATEFADWSDSVNVSASVGGLRFELGEFTGAAAATSYRPTKLEKVFCGFAFEDTTNRSVAATPSTTISSSGTNREVTWVYKDTTATAHMHFLLIGV
jgi:hypothetical protein